MAPFTLRLLLGLIAGLAGGVSADPASSPIAHVLFAASAMVSVLAHANDWRLPGAVAPWVAVATAAWLLGIHAVDAALNPPLRTMLEQRVGGFAMESEEEGRSEEPILIEGRIRQDAALGATGVIVRLSVDRIWFGSHAERTRGGVAAVVGGEMAAGALGMWTKGRRLRAPVRLRRPARYLNDGVPDMERALARRGVALVGTIKSSALVEVVAAGAPWEEWGARMRARVRAVLARYLPADRTNAAAVATAILIGDRAALGVEIERRLQEAGTYHVLAISGGNIAILAGTVLGLLALVGRRGRGAQLLAIAALVAYAVVVEGGPSVFRATSMALLYLGVRLIDQRTAPVNALALVVIGILLMEPMAITDVGLWLTCGATLGILLGAGALQHSARVPAGAPAARSVRGGVVEAGTAMLAPARRGQGAIADLLGRVVVAWSVARVARALVMATVAAEIVLMPVAAIVFQRVTVAGVALNFIAIPCMTVVQLGAMALVALDAAGLTSGARLAAAITDWGVFGLLGSARWVDYAPWLTWRVPAPPMWLVLAYYTALGTWWIASRPPVETPLRVYAVTVCGPLALMLFVWIAIHPPSLERALGDGRLHVTTIDVGQGDATLVTFPNGRRLLVDTGGVAGEFDVGDRVIGPALRARGVRTLDYLAITHGDPDHIGGARAIVRDFAPREIWEGVAVPAHEPSRLLREEAARVRAGWRTLQRGDHLDVGVVELHVLHPPPPDWERQKVRNDDSLVLALRFGDVSILLTGDISREVERTLIPTLSVRPLVVLKVPHHGSGTSSSPPFVEALSPAVATIGVGRGNPYGHPVPYVLERYMRAGTEIFRTDQDGQIEVVTDGDEIDVWTYTGRTWITVMNTKDTRDTK